MQMWSMLMQRCSHDVFNYPNNINSCTVKPRLSNHINKTYIWLFRQVVAYCCMKVMQRAPADIHLAIGNHLSIVISISPDWMLKTGLTVI